MSWPNGRCGVEIKVAGQYCEGCPRGRRPAGNIIEPDVGGVTAGPKAGCGKGVVPSSPRRERLQVGGDMSEVESRRGKKILLTGLSLDRRYFGVGGEEVIEISQGSSSSQAIQRP